jgi:hypothetical protein
MHGAMVDTANRPPGKSAAIDPKFAAGIFSPADEGRNVSQPSLTRAINVNDRR